MNSFGFLNSNPNNPQNSQNYESLYFLASQSSINDHAIGSVMGAFLGDAMGAPLEFTDITSSKLNVAMKLGGGGSFFLSQGQITDDSELALSLARGLVAEPFVLNLGKIASCYMDWYKSPPFDIGTTTTKALKGLSLKDQTENSYSRLYIKIKENSKSNNENSLSNGALMRITPLAVWCHRMTDFEDIEWAVKVENELTHPNETVHKANSLYVLAIKELINNDGNFDAAIEKIESILEEKTTIKHKLTAKPWKDIEEWFIDAHNPSQKQIPAFPHEGYMRIAWTYAMSALLKKQNNFCKGMREILEKGGDTDTNGCIYGGLIGAALGFKSLPKELVEKVLNCKHEYQRRPPQFHPKELVKLLPDIIGCAPETLLFRGVALECRISAESLYGRFEKFSNDSVRKNKTLACLFGFLWGEEDRKLKKNSKIFEEEKFEQGIQKKNSFDFIIRLIRKLTQLNWKKNDWVCEYGEVWKEKRSPIEILSTMIPLALFANFSLRPFEETLKSIKVALEKTSPELDLDETKECCLLVFQIFYWLLNENKQQQIITHIEKILDSEPENNKNLNKMRSWFSNVILHKIDSKDNKSLKSIMVIIFDLLKSPGGLDLIEREKLKIKAGDEENIGVIGALCGAAGGFNDLDKKKVEDILRKQRDPEFHLNNLLFLLGRISCSK